MRYDSRNQVERVGRAGSHYQIEDGLFKARVLSSFWLYCDPDDLGFTPHMTTKAEGYWEAWITTWMSQNVQPGSRCIDVGANMGYYTLFLLEHRCKVRAVEPQPKLADLIAKSVEENGFRLETGSVDECAISDKPGELKLYIPAGNGMNASLNGVRAQAVGEPVEEIEVEVCTLDDFCEGEPYYDFVKIDVEGLEDRVFRGMQKFIQENPDCVVLLEWHWARMDDPERSAREIFDVMDVSYVELDGSEVRLTDPMQLRQRYNEDWMLVLRKKK